jgi:hypothetical protein
MRGETNVLSRTRPLPSAPAAGKNGRSKKPDHGDRGAPVTGFIPRADPRQYADSGKGRETRKALAVSGSFSDRKGS